MRKVFVDGKQVGALVQELPELFPDWTIALEGLECNIIVPTLEQAETYATRFFEGRKVTYEE